jgi:OOP family OmpA-OmpF porin
MKKTLLIALLAAAAIAPAAQAETSYLGASIGRSEQNPSIDGINTLKDTAFKVTAGYMFNQTFGIEAGYVDLGKAEEKLGAFTIGSHPRALYIAATGTIPLSDRFALTGKIGAANTRTTLTSTGDPEDKYKETSALIGIGATFAITPSMLAVVEYENFGKIVKDDGENLKANMLSLGLRFKF